jgi:hypothetical protein
VLTGACALHRCRDNAKTFVRLLCAGCRWAEGRAIAAAQLEGLIGQTAQARYGLQLLEVLLACVCTNEQVRLQTDAWGGWTDRGTGHARHVRQTDR